MYRIFVLLILMLPLYGSANTKSSRIAVVGGGIAGLTTAYRLQQSGFEVNLYEARGRTGGRIFTAQINGHVVELGGQNISDGAAAPCVSALVNELGLELVTTPTDIRCHYFDGQHILPEIDFLQDQDPEELYQRLYQLAQNCSNMQEVLLQLFDKDSSAYKVLSTRLAAYEGASIEKLSTVYIETLYPMLLGGLSAVHQDSIVHLVGIKDGNAMLTQALTEQLGTHVHLKKPLTVLAKNNDHSYTLTFADGSTATADIVVLAIPCPVYKRIQIDANVIPADQLQAIYQVLYGTNAKIIVPLTPPPSQRAYISDNSVAFLIQNRQAVTLYLVGEAGHFSPQTLADRYTEGLQLLSVAYGPEQVSAVEPRLAHDTQFASYACPVGHSWPNDPYAGGSYSCIAAGQEISFTELQTYHDEQIKTLFAPVNETLFFAGEHTSIMLDIGGTIEAACESGERTARMIKTLYSQQ